MLTGQEILLIVLVSPPLVAKRSFPRLVIGHAASSFDLGRLSFVIPGRLQQSFYARTLVALRIVSGRREA